MITLRRRLGDVQVEPIQPVLAYDQPKVWHSTPRGLRTPMAVLVRPKIGDTAETTSLGYKSNGRTACDLGQRTCR